MIFLNQVFDKRLYTKSKFKYIMSDFVHVIFFYNLLSADCNFEKKNKNKTKQNKTKQKKQP